MFTNTPLGFGLKIISQLFPKFLESWAKHDKTFPLEFIIEGNLQALVHLGHYYHKINAETNKIL